MNALKEAPPTLGNTFRLHGYEPDVRIARKDQCRKSIEILMSGMLIIAATALAQPAPAPADESAHFQTAISGQPHSQEGMNALITVVGSAMLAAAGIWVSTRATASPQ